MSFFSKLKVDVEHFFSDVVGGNIGTDVEKFVKAFTTLFHKAPAVLQVAQNFIDELAPVLTGVVDVADISFGAEVSEALSVAETALAGLQAALTAAKTGNSFLGQLKNFASDIPALLTSLDVKDEGLKAKIEWIVNFITSESKVIIPVVEKFVK